MKNNLTTTKNTDIILKKSKSMLNITNRILSGKTALTKEVIEDWIKELWAWADSNNIDSDIIPREKDLLLALETIDLSGLELETLTSRLCFVEYVTTLILADNQIKELPKEIVNFRNLKLLNLKNNPLVLTPMQERWIEQLQEKGCEVYLGSDLVKSQNSDLVDESWIERLWDWADNSYISDYKWIEDVRSPDGGYYEGLPRDKQILLSFTELRLYDNQLTELPKEIGNLTKLKELNLEKNPNLTLTQSQKEWIQELKRRNSNTIFMDDDLLTRNYTIPEIDIDDDEIPF